MHHCLEVAEIIWLIAECMDGESDRLPTLLSMALTCKAFKEPVFRVLWRDLDSLVPLLRCFPEDLWGKADDEEGWIRGPLRPVSIADWERVLFYGAHVRKYSSFDDYYPYDLYEALFFLLANIPSGCRLFPNLQHLEWDYGDTAALYAKLFVSKDLKIATFRSRDDDLPQFVQSLADSAPYLRRLTVRPGPADPTGLSWVLNQRAGRFAKLQALECPFASFTQASLIQLATLAHLETLDCTLDPAGDGPGYSPALCTKSFASLTVLKLRLASLASRAVSLLLSCRMPKLLVFHVLLEQTCSHTRFYSLLQMMGSHSTLQDIKIASELTVAYDGRDHGPKAELCLSPLLHCHDLRTLYLSTRLCVCKLSEVTFGQMGDAWPRLQDLTIGPNICKTNTGISYRALHALASRCHELHAVAAQVDFLMLSDDYLRAPSYSPCPALKRLVVFPGSPYPDIALAAAVVSPAFPRVVVQCPPTWSETSSADFARLMSLFALTRRQPSLPVSFCSSYLDDR